MQRGEVRCAWPDPPPDRSTGLQTADNFCTPACHLPAVMPAISACRNLHPNLPIHPRRNSNRHVRADRQKHQTSGPTSIIIISHAQELANSHPYRLCHISVWCVAGGGNLCGCYIPNPTCRLITTPHSSIFQHITGNICQLHGDAKVNGMRLCRVIITIKHMTH